MIDKTQERISNCHYLNTSDLVMKVSIVFDGDNRTVGSFAEPRMQINGMDAEKIQFSGSGLIYLEHDGNSKFTKEYLIHPDDVYLFRCTDKIIEWNESYIKH
tara:strand:+ start:12471 stop:12776 length:306 start_codon:yes stop_codon:yes gene_type:complete